MGEKGGVSSFLYGKNVFRYHVVPIVFLFSFTSIIQVLALWGQGKPFKLDLAIENLKGDYTSWLWTLAFYAWAWIWIRLSTKFCFGQETTYGHKPKYADNGWTYYVTTMAVFALLQSVYPTFSRTLYEEFPKFLGVSNTIALLLCAWLHIKGKWFPEYPGDAAEPAPIPYEFYRGMELHPTVFGVLAKQFTNCRVGMMTWPIFLAAFTIVGLQENGFNMPILVHFLIQMLYITKFYWWEREYFHTPDMILDRAGYYLCWGCLVFIPSYFCFPISYVVTHRPIMSDALSVAIAVLGLGATYLEYLIDHQKTEFRAHWPNKTYRGGKPATFIVAEYKDDKGNLKKSPLLTSGFWGTARHLNYSVELVISFTISASLGFNHGVWTFAYFLFILPLILHRTLRDDAKCSAKYGKYWLKYKQDVKYVLLPGIY